MMHLATVKSLNCHDTPSNSQIAELMWHTWQQPNHLITMTYLATVKLSNYHNTPGKSQIIQLPWHTWQQSNCWIIMTPGNSQIIELITELPRHTWQQSNRWSTMMHLATLNYHDTPGNSQSTEFPELAHQGGLSSGAPHCYWFNARSFIVLLSNIYGCQVVTGLHKLLSMYHTITMPVPSCCSTNKNYVQRQLLS